MSKFSGIAIEADIVARAKCGDRTALESLYRALAGPVHGLTARILGDRQLAAEATQDTFLDVIENAASLSDAGAVGWWVRRIAVNQCLRRLRSPWHRRRVWLDSPVEEAGDTPRPDQRRDLENALATLSAPSRFVVWMHDVEGYTHKEIGELLGKTESFSKSQLARAHARLLGYFEGGSADERARHNGTH